jgi:ABC-type sugar transport system ATPase subunit
MNLLPAIVMGPTEGGIRFRIGEEETTIAVVPAVSRLPSGSPVTLGIRPRGLEVVSESGARSFASRVDLIEPMGAETLIHLVEGGRELRVVVDPRVEVRIGSQVHLRPRPDQTHVFDASERRIR